MSNEDNCEQIYIETLGSIETIHKIDELYNPEFECNLVEALKSKKNIIEKAKMDSINRIVYKQKAKFARSIDSLANTDYQDTYQNQTNELNSNYNNNNSSINENYEDLKLFENCSANKKKKTLIENYNLNPNNNANNNVYSKYANNTFMNNNNNFNNLIIANNKTNFMNNSILNNKLIEEKNFESNQIGRKLKILKNFDDIDEKIKFGYISVVPKTSLLYVNENKFLSYKEMKKDMKRKELEKHQKLRESSLRSVQNPTPFQHFEITKNILREKIRFKMDINANHKSLLKNIVDGGESGLGTKRNSIKSTTLNFHDLTKDERNFMEMSRSNKDNFTKTRLPTISTRQGFNQQAHHLTIFDKFNVAYNSNQNPNKNEDYKLVTNYNKTGMRSGFNSHYETDRMFHLNSKYRENSELNILEETQNQDLSSLDGKSECKKSKLESGNKIEFVGNFNSEGNSNDKERIKNNSSPEKKNFSKNRNIDKNSSNNVKKSENKINVIEQQKLDTSLVNTSKPNLNSNKSYSRLSSTFKEKAKVKKKASQLSAQSKTLNSDLNSNHNANNNNNNNNDISGLINEQNINLQNLPTIESNVVLRNLGIEEEEEISEVKQLKKNNKENSLSGDKCGAFAGCPGKKNPIGNQDVKNEIVNCSNNNNNNNNFTNSLDSSNLLNRNDISKLYSNKKANKVNNRSFETNKSILLEKENECVKYKKNEKRVFPNEPTFYGKIDLGLLNNKKNSANKSLAKSAINKLDYVNAAKTTLNYLSSALKTSNQLDSKKPLFSLNPYINTNSFENNYNSNNYYNNNNAKISASPTKPVRKNNNFNNNINNGLKTYENYLGLGFQEKLHHNSNKKQLDKLKTHLHKNSQNEILVKEILDHSINDKVEIFKSILNSRDYIPRSEYDLCCTPKLLRPINYSNYKNKNKKGFLNENFFTNSDHKMFNAAEDFVIKDGYSFTPKKGKGLFRKREKQN